MNDVIRPSNPMGSATGIGIMCHTQDYVVAVHVADFAAAQRIRDYLSSLVTATPSETCDQLRVRLAKDIYDDGQDHHPPSYVGRKGDMVVIHSIQTAVVSHRGTGDGFVVHDNELELSVSNKSVSHRFCTNCGGELVQGSCPRCSSQKASDECCCAERGGGLVCILPKGHAGQHEAWGARKNLLQSWPAMKADPPRGAKARDFVEYDPYGGVRVDMARYLRSPAGQAQLQALGGKKASERQPCSHGNATGHCQHCLDAL